MARQITEVLIDDIDGGNASVSVQFAYEGKSYAIDLNKRNAKKFDDAINALDYRWPSRHREVWFRPQVDDRLGPCVPVAVRAWAKENGREVSARGRIAQQTLDALQGRALT